MPHFRKQSGPPGRIPAQQGLAVFLHPGACGIGDAVWFSDKMDNVFMRKDRQASSGKSPETERIQENKNREIIRLVGSFYAYSN